MGAGLKVAFSELVDIKVLDGMLKTLYEVARIPSAIIDTEGKILTGAGWQRICTEFFRARPEAEKTCIASDTRIREEIQRGEPFVIYHCPHGLVDSCCPVMLEGQHVANVFTGQFLHEPLTDETLERFKAIGRSYGFDEQAYLAALREVPVFSPEAHRKILTLLSELAAYVAEMGMARLRAQEQTRVAEASEERFRRLFQHSAAGMVLVDPSFRFLRANDAFCRMLGYDEAALVKMSFQDVTHPEDRARSAELTRSIMAGEKDAFHFEKRYVRRDGTVVWGLVSSTLIRDGQGVPLHFVTQILDITERKAMEERLRQSEKMEAIGQLAGGVAHDFNNMLGAILGYAELVGERSTDPEVKGHAELIMSAAQRSAALTGQLLAFARRGKYQLLPVDMHVTIGEVVALLEHSIDKRIAIEQRLEAEYAVVTGDPTQLNNALLNLALNARDAMPNGGTLTFVTLNVENDESLRGSLAVEVAGGRLLRVDVRDSGTGISDETRKHLFEPFFTTKELGKGTGLGLASVYGTVRNHGGAISVQSEPGEGTTFSLFLPLASRPEATQQAPAPATQAQGGGRLLVIEDEPLLRKLLAEGLEHLGYSVRLAHNGADGVALYARDWHSIDLVLLDMVMPVMGGHETLVELRRINPQVKAVVISGYALDSEARRVMESGAVAFVAKPFKLTELSEQVALLLGAPAKSG